MENIVPITFWSLVALMGVIWLVTRFRRNRKTKPEYVPFEQSLKVCNANICVDCDEISNQTVCPKCLSPYYYKLSDSAIKPIFASWEDILRQAKENKANGKPTSLRDIQKEVSHKKAPAIRDDVLAPVNVKFGKRKNKAISCDEATGAADCITA